MPTKTRVLKKLEASGKKISFMVKTPTSKDGEIIQNVSLSNFHIWRTRTGNDVITGRDRYKEALSDYNEHNKFLKERDRQKSQKTFRTYRVDRIVNGSICQQYSYS